MPNIGLNKKCLPTEHNFINFPFAFDFVNDFVGLYTEATIPVLVNFQVFSAPTCTINKNRCVQSLLYSSN